MDLAEYTLKITGNPNKFPDYSMKEKKNPDGSVTQIIISRDDSLTNIVRAEARQIYHLTYSANEINLTRQPWRKGERIGNQAKAIEICGYLLADIQLCKAHFHLPKKKILYWGGKVRDLRIAIEGWHEKDKDRYKDI